MLQRSFGRGFAAICLLPRFDESLTGQRDVAVFLTDLHGAVAACDAVRKMRRPPSFHAHGVEFGHFFSQGQQLGHDTKGNAFEIQVQSGSDDPDAVVGEGDARGRQFGIKELRLVDGNYGYRSRLSTQKIEDALA